MAEQRRRGKRDHERTPGAPLTLFSRSFATRELIDESWCQSSVAPDIFTRSACTLKSCAKKLLYSAGVEPIAI